MRSIISFITGTYAVLTPVFAKDVFNGDAQTLGMLLAAVGVGAVASAFLLAAKRSVLGLGGWLVNSALLFGACLIGYGESGSYLIALPMLAGIGFGMMSHMTATNTLVQTIIDNRMRGRVMAFYTMAFVGTMPIGSLICGFVSAAIGPRLTLVIAGGITIFASFLFRLVLPRIRELVRPIYIERGILEAEVV